MIRKAFFWLSWFVILVTSGFSAGFALLILYYIKPIIREIVSEINQAQREFNPGNRANEFSDDTLEEMK